MRSLTEVGDRATTEESLMAVYRPQRHFPEAHCAERASYVLRASPFDTRISASGKAGTGRRSRERPRLCGRARRRLGLKRGDKLAILGSNRPRLYWSMAAAQWLGAIPVPVYADSVADEIAYVLAHAEVTHAVVQDQEQVDKLLSVIDQLPSLVHILYDKDRGLRDYDHTRLHAHGQR